MLAMEDAGFIFGAYVVTFGAVAAYAVHVLRRARRSEAPRAAPDESAPGPTDGVLRFGEVTVDLRERSVQRGEDPVKLTQSTAGCDDSS